LQLLETPAPFTILRKWSYYDFTNSKTGTESYVSTGHALPDIEDPTHIKIIKDFVQDLIEKDIANGITTATDEGVDEGMDKGSKPRRCKEVVPNIRTAAGRIASKGIHKANGGTSGKV
jgi:hypothetical protein